MNAINHTATALLIHRKWPGIPMVATLVGVQFIECLWVIFNLLGIEAATTEPQVRALDDIHLSYMPYSHSIGSTVVLAALVWLVTAKVFRKPQWAPALAAAVCSHIILDLATHVPDIALAPGFDTPKFGVGLYGIPMVALVVETIYGVWCWWMFRGSKALLAIIVLFNLGALSFYASFIPGPEMLLAGHPKIFATVIGLHIVSAWVAVGLLARSQWEAGATHLP